MTEDHDLDGQIGRWPARFLALWPLRRPPHVHVGEPLLVLPAVGAANVAPATREVERVGTGVLLEDPEVEAVGRNVLGPVDEPAPYPPALRVGVDVEVLEPAGSGGGEADHCAVLHRHLDPGLGDDGGEEAGALLGAVENGEVGRLRPGGTEDLGDRRESPGRAGRRVTPVMGQS